MTNKRILQSAVCAVLLLACLVISVSANEVRDIGTEGVIPIETQSVKQETSNALECDKRTESAHQSSLIVDIVLPLGLEFFGAFLGVLSALALDSVSEKKQWKEINSSLYCELQVIGNELKERDKEDYSYYQYITPVWDINMAAGNLSLLTHSKARKKLIKKDYIDIYAKIHYAQTLERDYIQGRLLMLSSCSTTVSEDQITTDYINLIDNARKREANSILDMIQKLPKEAK